MKCFQRIDDGNALWFKVFTYLLQDRRLLFHGDEIRNVVEIWWKPRDAEGVEIRFLGDSVWL